MILGVESCFEDGTPSVQLWDSTTRETLGEFVKGSPKIPKDILLCKTVGELKYYMQEGGN